MSFILGIMISNSNFKLFVVRDPISIDTFNHFLLKDANSKGSSLSDDEKKLFPLAEDHWINQPVRN